MSTILHTSLWSILLYIIGTFHAFYLCWFFRYWTCRVAFFRPKIRCAWHHFLFRWITFSVWELGGWNFTVRRGRIELSNSTYYASLPLLGLLISSCCVFWIRYRMSQRVQNFYKNLGQHKSSEDERKTGQQFLPEKQLAKVIKKTNRLVLSTVLKKKK